MQIGYRSLDALIAMDAPPTSETTMYAIIFDLDTDALKRYYGGPSLQNGYTEIRRILEDEGFEC